MKNLFKLLGAAAAIVLFAEGCNSRAPKGWIGADDSLSVDEKGFLRNQKGQEVVLRGVNLGVAIHVGGFNNDNGGNQTYAYGRYNSNNISWNMWTYKIAEANMGNWSLYQAPRKLNADPHTDSLDVIKQKWGETLRTFDPGTNTPANGYIRMGMYNIFTAGLNQVP